jgi:hypothetical protein
VCRTNWDKMVHSIGNSILFQLFCWLYVTCLRLSLIQPEPLV